MKLPGFVGPAIGTVHKVDNGEVGDGHMSERILHEDWKAIDDVWYERENATAGRLIYKFSHSMWRDAPVIAMHQIGERVDCVKTGDYSQPPSVLVELAESDLVDLVNIKAPR